MPAKIDQCDVLLGDNLEPLSANAIRIADIEGLPSDCFLDFLTYIPHLDKAVVVSRIQIKRGFLPHLLDYLADNLGKPLLRV